MTSLRFKAMESQIRWIGKTLLPRDQNKPALRRGTRLRLISYRILCHAEIEHYFEERVLEIAEAAAKSWKNRGHVSTATIALLAFSGQTLSRPPKSLTPTNNQSQTKWDEGLSCAKSIIGSVNAFLSHVKHYNHGIKEENLLSMLLPIGFGPADFDPILVTEINNLAVMRGQAAHTTTLGQVKNALMPKDESDRIARIVMGLTSVDGRLDGIMSTAV